MAEYEEPENGASSTEEDDEEEKPRKIVVSNLPPNVEVDDVQGYFESKKRTGGGIIKEIDYDEEKNRAIIEYEDPSVVDSVLEHLPIQMSKRNLDVKIYTELSDDDFNKSRTTETDSPMKILVTNIPDGVETDDLEMIFENEKRTGGGAIASIEYDEAQGSAVIEFEEPGTAESVISYVKTSAVRLLKTTLEVQVYIEDIEEKDKIAIFGLPEDIDDDFLEIFFQRKKQPFAGKVVNVELDADQNRAMVHFESEETVDKIMNNLPISMMKTELDIRRFSAKTWQDNASANTDDYPEDDSKKPTMIRVMDLPRDTTTDLLELFFDRDGAEIESIDYEDGSTSAVIEFRKYETVNKLVSNQPMKFLKKATISIEPYVPVPIIYNKVEVRGPAKAVTEEMMRMYFENPERSGGGEIEDVDVSEGREENIAFITFASEDVAKAVAERVHVLMRSNLNVTLCDPAQAENKDTSDDRTPEKQDEQDEPKTTVKVKGVKKFSSPDPVRFYFENKRRSGGGKILDLSFCEDEDEALITFESSEIAQTVVKKLDHTIDKQELAVSLYTPTAQRPCYTKTLLVKGIGSRTSQDCLLNFLEAKCGAAPVEFMYGEDDGTKLVTFDNEPDFEKLQRECEKHPLEESYLLISKVPVSNCINITNIDESIAEETVELYFSNHKKSGGGPVEKVQLKDGGCLVFFEIQEDLDRVMHREHMLSGKKLDIVLYHECLGKYQGDGFQALFSCPADVTTDDIEQDKLTFLLRSENCRDMFEKKLMECYASLVWPEDGKVIKHVTIKCMLTQNLENSVELSKTWAETVLKIFQSLLEDIMVTSLTVPAENWSKMNESLGKITLSDPRMVMISRNNEARTILIVGEKQSANELSCKIKEIIQKLAHDLEMERRTKSERISLDELKIKAFMKASLKEKVESETSVAITVDQKANQVIVTGQEEKVGKAGMMIYRLTGEYTWSSVQMSTRVMELMQRKSVQQYLEQKWNKQNLVAVWKSGERSINLCAQQVHIQQCIDIMKKTFHEEDINVDASTICVVNSDKWKKMVAALEGDLMKKFVISVSESHTRISFCSTDDVRTDVLNAVSTFFSTNTLLTKDLDIPTAVAKFVSKYCIARLSSIAKLHKDKFVKINVSKTFVISVSGNKDGIVKAEQQVMDLINTVQMKKVKLRRPGLALHLKTPDGKDLLCNIEKEFPCMIEIENKKKNRGQDSDSIQPKESFHLKDGKVVNLYQGDITELQADALICAADKQLKLKAGLGKVIMSKGGVDIRNECRKFIQNNSDLQEGQILSCPPGGALCRVLFVHGPEWKDGSQKEIQRLEDVVIKAMIHAASESATDVALPAICCGKSGFRMEIGTKTIVEAVKKYFKDHPQTSIHTVLLADVSAPTVAKFSESMKSVFWNAQHSIFQEPHVQPDSKALSKPAVNVAVVKGQLAKQEVDVIVNTASRSLELTQGAVSASIIKGAGQDMKSEIEKEYPKGIMEGQIAYTKGYKLRCDMVMHTALYPWTDKKGKALETMTGAMEECLLEAHRHEYASIALPAFGTGTLGYPHETVAKAMFETVNSVIEKIRDFRVSDIRFVIYEKDTSILQVFEKEQNRWKGKLSQVDISAKDSDSDSDDDDFDIIKAPGVYNIGSMMLVVKTGDLSKENCECIVNSTDLHLDMKRGAVAQALLRRAGKRLQEELDGKRREMRQNHIIMTDGYKLSCDKLIHAEAQRTTDQWKDMMLKCLQLADDNTLSSIAFPAIGSGFGLKTEEMATLVFTAITEFQVKQPMHLQEVRFVLFNDKMFDEFCDIVDSAIEHKSKGIFGSLWSGLKHMFTATAQPKESVAKQKRKRAEDTVNLTIYAMSDTVMNNVTRRLQSNFEQMMYRKKFDKPIIKRFGENQKKDIDTVCQQYHVSLTTLDIGSGVIEIEGIKENTFEAADRIYDIIRDAERAEYSNQMAEVQAAVIQWYYIDTIGGGQQLCKYKPEQNGDIEDSYKAKEDRMEIIMKHADGERCHVIDFMLMKQYELHRPDIQTTVIRRDLLRESSCGAPAHWKDVKDGLSEHQLSSTDEDYEQISQMFMHSSGGGYTIQSIKRIQNMHLWQQYQTKNKQLEQQNPSTTVNERTLWHGTKPISVGSINLHGFNRSYCGGNATAFGDGVYFAMKAVTACNTMYAVEDTDGTKNVYYCRVLTGEFEQGKQGARVPPPKPSGGPSAMYDSLVDTTANPTLFVIFNDTQAYPEYLITFKRV